MTRVELTLRNIVSRADVATKFLELNLGETKGLSKLQMSVMIDKKLKAEKEFEEAWNGASEVYFDESHWLSDYPSH